MADERAKRDRGTTAGKSSVLQALGLACVLLGAPGVQAHAEPVSDETRQLLDHIMKEYDANRARTLDLRLTGTITEARLWDGNVVSGQGDFQYYRLGQKMRTDVTQSQDSPMLTLGVGPGHTLRLALNNDRTLRHEPGTTFGNISPPVNFQEWSASKYLDNLARSRAWSNHMDHVRFLLERGWDPQRESIQVETRQEDGQTLLVIHYETTRGGSLGTYTWVVDPRRGYEVVHATDTRGWAPELWEAEYDVREVSPGVWRSVGTKINVTDPTNEASPPIMQIEMTCESVAANTGLVDEAMFTLAGMGLPKRALVQDDTFDPPLRYFLGDPPLRQRDLEVTIQEAAAPAEFHPAASQPAASAPAEPQTQPSTGSVPVPKGFHPPARTWWWVGLIFLVSAVIGFQIKRRMAAKHRQIGMKS